MTVELKARNIFPPKTTVKRTRESIFFAALENLSNNSQHKRERVFRTTQTRDHNEIREEMYQRLKTSN
jgi:hypothetical protein